jgi:TPR repeat protein
MHGFMPRWCLLPLLLLSASVSAGDLVTELAAKAGAAFAQYTLGNHYYSGEEGYPQDYERAAYWYLKAAKGGNAKGQLAIGIVYRRGQGVSADMDAALYWMKKSAGNGHSLAMYNLGQFYLNKADRPSTGSYATEAYAWFVVTRDHDGPHAGSAGHEISQLDARMTREETSFARSRARTLRSAIGL